MWNTLRKLSHDVGGAVAPTVALSLFGLIAAGGVAFDYARLAALDTELQQAADNAALAAATQLDRADDSQERATDAISGPNATRLAANVTRFANDGGGASVEITNIVFCSAFDDSIANTTAACTVAGEPSESRFVVVTTAARTAKYALTPIVAAFSSGQISATAVAGVESSICNIAPLLVCAPTADFPTAADIGKGVVLKPFGGQNSWAPGNYGLLDFGSGNTGVRNALLGFGLSGCQEADDNKTEPGTKEVTDAINSRLDVYEGNNPVTCNAATGAGCPAASARKDMVLKYNSVYETTTNVKPSLATVEPTAPVCPASPVLSNQVEFLKPDSPVVGLGRDTCHYSGNCSGGNFGNGTWDRAGYFAQHYGGDASGALSFSGKDSIDELTRYDVYLWELDDAAARLARRRHLSIDDVPKQKGGGSNIRYEWTVRAQCNYGSPVFGNTAYPEQKDRRILPVVAADCTNLNGSGQIYQDYTLLRVFDILITEPSEDRTYPGPTDHKEIYAEIVGPAQTFEGGGGFQYYSRNKPYLVR